MKDVVLISGGLGVLGQAYARVLTEDGYDVLALDCKEPENDGFTGEFFACDITNEAQVETLGKHLESKGAEVHGLINNASCQPEGFTNELEDYSLSSYRAVLDVNLLGSFLLTRMSVPLMQARGKGSIVNVGSIQGVVAPTFEMYEDTDITSPLAYSVAKAAMIHSSKWVASRYGPDGIRCNAVSPGGVNDHQKGGAEFSVKYASKTPLRRMAHSTDVAEAVRFLMSDRASYITGQNLVVDGGWTIY